MVAEPKYKVQDKVLCFHGAMLYEAKILNIATPDETPKYFVHYQGWNNRYDEWVLDDRLLEFNDENVKKQQELNAKSSATGGKTGSSQKSRTSQGAGTNAEESSETPSSKSKKAGGKQKTSTGSSGPSTPFDGSSAKACGTGETGLELESRASTPSVDGGVSVASSSTTGNISQTASKKRKAVGKTKTGGSSIGGSVPHTPAGDTSQSVTGEPQSTPVTTEPKRKRARPNAPTSSATTIMQPPGGNTTGAPSDSANPAPAIQSFDDFRGRQEVQIRMPDELKELIVDDWDLVMRQNKLYNLPATKTVDEILSDYGKQKGNQKGNPQRQTNIHETINGIRNYFNAMCGVHLLYKFERPQYMKALEELQPQDENDETASAENGSAAPNRRQLSSYYGFPHLLRLFVTMGKMLAYTQLEQKSIDLVVTWMHDFLKFLTKNRATYFRLEDYITASPEYQRQAFTN